MAEHEIYEELRIFEPGNHPLVGQRERATEHGRRCAAPQLAGFAGPEDSVPLGDYARLRFSCARHQASPRRFCVVSRIEADECTFR